MIALTETITITLAGGEETEIAGNSILGNELAVIGAWMSGLYFNLGARSTTTEI